MVSEGEIETIYAGSRPNLYRIYDKVKEYRCQFQVMLRRASKDADLPEFEKEFGVKETDVVTRFERQCGATGIPRGLATFGSLHQLIDYNPFDAIQIVSLRSSDITKTTEDCTRY